MEHGSRNCNAARLAKQRREHSPIPRRDVPHTSRSDRPREIPIRLGNLDQCRCLSMTEQLNSIHPPGPPDVQ
jgi:hypothetical protein